MRIGIFVVVAIALVAGEAARADNVFVGAGALSCGDLARRYRESPGIFEAVYFAWAQGFMSGLNASDVRASGKARDLSSMTTDEQRRRLRIYCDAHPLADSFAAVLDLYKELNIAEPPR